MNTSLTFQFLGKKTSKKTNSLRLLLCILTLVIQLSNTLFAQDKLFIENGDLVILRPDENNQTQLLYKNTQGQARLKQKNTTIESDSTKFFEKRNYAEAMGNVYINQNDSVDIYSNRANYFGNLRKAELIGEVALIKEFYTLQTDKLNYNLDTKIATYNTGGELSDTSSVLTSKKGRYNLVTDEAVFTDSVVLVSPERRIETEQLTYNLNDKWAYFEGPTTIFEEDQIINTTKGKYNSETGEAIIEGDPEIENEESIFKADYLELKEEGGVGDAKGNVYYYDKENEVELTSQMAKQLNDDEIEARDDVRIYNEKDSVELKAEFTIINQTENEFYAEDNVRLNLLTQQTELLSDTLTVKENEGYAISKGRPFLTTVEEEDSIFMIAQTLEAFRQDNTPDSVYNYVANKQFKLFKSDLQAVADSAYVNNIDSTITLFKNPVIWSDSTQMSADTIRIFLKNQQIDRVEFRQNSFFINLVDKGLYNQMKGRNMDAFFVEEQIDSLFVDGNGETIFYVLDEFDAYVGVDKMTSGQMEVLFEQGQMKEVFWLNNQEGTTFPFQEIDPDEFKLSGFAWKESLKPQSKDYLLIAAKRKEGELPEEVIILPPKSVQDQNKITLGGADEEVEEEDSTENQKEN